jgi:hypothetical protein
MEICVDFDGTCVTHDYPEIGRSIGAEFVLRRLTVCGHKLILFTMRSGDHLQEAVDWFKLREIPLYGINVNPTQQRWTTSPKAYGQLYIDDAALGVPLVTPSKGRQYVDWGRIERLLAERGLFDVAGEA